MADLAPGERLRLALSFCEVARRTHPEAPGLTGKADFLLAQVRDRLRADIEGASETLREALAEREKLSASVTSARTDPEAANRKGRELARRIAELQGVVAEYNRLLKAERSADLGGTVELPLDEYSQRIGIDSPRRRPPFRFWPPPPLVAPEPTVWGIEVMPTRFGAIVWGVVLAVATLISLGYLGYLGPQSGLTLSIHHNDKTPSIVVVECAAEGPKQVALYVPMADSEVQGSKAGFGIRIEVKDKSAAAYRRIPSSEEAWRYAENPLRESTEIDITPGAPAVLTLNVGRIRRAFPEAESVRLTVVRPNGSEGAQYTLD